MTELANDKREKKALMLSKKQLGKNNVKMIYNNYNSIMKKKHTKNNLTLPNKIASLTERCINESSKNKTITSTNRKTLNVHSRNAINGILSNHRHIVSLSKKIFKTKAPIVNSSGFPRLTIKLKNTNLISLKSDSKRATTVWK